MKDKISHGGSAITVIEYEVREIDEHGDSQDVHHYENRREAIAAAKKLMAWGNAPKAIVIEKHVSKRPTFLFNEPDVFKPVCVLGDRDALEAGGWLKMETSWLED
jgi:hypothetical protein